MTPIKTSDTLKDSVANFLHSLYAYDVFYTFEDGCRPFAKCAAVSQLRLNGNHSKEYLLRCVLTSAGTNLLDLRDCVNFDDECLGAMLFYIYKERDRVMGHESDADDMCKVLIVLLNGTSINENTSLAIQKVRQEKRDIRSNFRAGLCAYCGHSPDIKQSTTTTTTTTPLLEANNKLGAENQRLREDLLKLQRQMNELYFSV
jgi:hypothetical protein